MPLRVLCKAKPMPSKTYLSSSSVTAFDLSIQTSIKRSNSPESLMSSTSSSSSSGPVSKFLIPPSVTIKRTSSPSKASTPTTDPGGGSTSFSSSDTDEVKVFGCEKHEEDVDIDGDNNSDRLSPVVKEEEASPPQPSSANLADRLNSEHQFHSFFPYFISPYYHAAAAAAGNSTQSFDKMVQLGSLSKFMSPPPAHLPPGNLAIDPNTGVTNPMYTLSSPTSFPSLYAQHWRPPMFPFVFPAGYPFPSAVLPQGSSSSNSSTSGHSHSMATHSNPSMMSKRSAQHRSIDQNSHQLSHSKMAMPQDEQKQKKPHIKKPLNAFMLFMKEQRAQVVQECTLRESAAINQILGRKWHELDRNVQQKYYDMARDERMKHMQLYPGWSARDNYGARKKRGNKGKKREKSQGENGECLNQKKCRARFGLDQQSNWCKHCKRKKKCLRYTEDDTNGIGPNSVGGGPWSDDDEGDHMEESDDDLDHCDIPMMENPQSGHGRERDRNVHSPLRTGISIDSDEENKSRLLIHQQTPNSNASGSSSSTNGILPMNLMTTSSTIRKDSSSSSSSSPQATFLHRYSSAPSTGHFHPPHPYFDPFLQSTPLPLITGLKHEA